MEIAFPDNPAVRPRRPMEDFRGDFEGLAGLIEDSWAENKAQPLLYTAEVLESYFSYPGADFGLAPTIYEGSRIMAFIAGFPRNVVYQGKRLRIIVVSFLSVANEYKKRGYALLLWDELVKRARAAGFAGVMNYCVVGDAMNKMMLGTYKCMRVPAARIFSIQYLMRPIVAKHDTREPKSQDSDLTSGFLDAASSLAARTPLCRHWSREEVEWQSLHRANSIVVSRSSGARRGYLTGNYMSIADRYRTKCLLVEDVLWDDLPVEERCSMVQELVDRAASESARMVVVPVQGYADPAPFLRSRFLRSPRVLQAYFGLLSDGLPPEPVSSFYVDVF